MDGGFNAGRWVSSINSIIACLLFIIVSVELTSAEVCKLAYKGRPEDFNDSTMYVFDNIVALSETLYVGTPININTDTFTTPTIFFVIDHSGSMYVDDPNYPPTDPEGYRFKVTRDLVDRVSEKFPKAEIGFDVFNEYLYMYYPDDPDYFAKCPPPQKDNSAYIPLYVLEERYGPANMLGIDVITKYLETEDSPWGYKELVYEPPYGWFESVSTNITAGFQAAKHAMLSSRYPKSHHFIVFLSDGVANMPQDATMDEYVDGVNTPTTFTVYFTLDSLAPGKLLTMTENIKINGYSQSNKWSNIWAFYNTDYAKLMDFLYNNVIGLINSILQGSPTVIIVNDSIQANNWNYQFFTFNEMLPLTGVKTDIKYTIQYHIKKDTVIDTSVVTIEYDDTIDVNFSVVLDENVDTLPEKFCVHCWDRTLGFYHNNSEITSAYENMGTLELRFTEYEVDILYGYTDVSVELTNTNRRDKETLVLNSQGAYFSNTFPIKALDAGQNPVSGNGTLELEFTDSIIAIFRNKDLPLDTVYVSIPFIKDSKIVIKSADYHDEKVGDGLIDSIFLTYESDKILTDDHIKEVIDQLTLPVWRQLSVLSYSFTETTISLTVEQSPSVSAVTHVTDQDTLHVAEKILNAGGMLFAATIPIGDKIPPLLEAAHLVDYWDNTINDLLTVAFSEKIHSVNNSRPFYFKSMANNGAVYYADLTLSSSQDSIMVFTVQSITGVQSQIDAMAAGDSVWISTDAENVTDIVSNIQDHPNNRRCVLTVEREKIPLQLISADYHDEKLGDGLIDSIFITYDCDVVLSDNHVQEIAGQLTLPAWRYLTILSSGLSNNGIALNVGQSSSADVVTYVTSEDTLHITEKVFNFDGVWEIQLSGGTVQIGDKIPPLIEAAHLNDNMDDTKDDILTVTFSEKINRVDKSRPFYFKSMKSNEAIYYTEQNLISSEDTKMVFKVLSINGVQSEILYMMEGDSIWISTDDDNVIDVKGNLQDHPNNRRRILTVEREPFPFTLIPKGIGPIDLSELRNKNGPKIPAEIVSILDEDNKSVVIDNWNTGMLLRVVPKEADKIIPTEFRLEGALTIFDAVSNQIITDRRMGYHAESRSANYVWDCRNSNGRITGSGTYLVVFKVTPKLGPELEIVSKPRTLQLLIGVKE